MCRSSGDRATGRRDADQRADSMRRRTIADLRGWEHPEKANEWELNEITESDAFTSRGNPARRTVKPERVYQSTLVSVVRYP
jgi:hypothetical protein